MAADYQIEAELSVNTRAAGAGLQTLSQRLGSMGSALKGTSGMFGGMVAQAVAFGGAYLGVSAMVGGFRSLATAAFEFENQVGGARLGLQSIMAQVEGITDAAGNWHPVGFEQARALSDETYETMQEMAITSSATSAELLGIFQSTYGAARSAGSSMEEVYALTANASTAAAALGIDFQQASRDMGAMLRGGAGLDVKLFSSLRSMNAIAMDAQEFNALAPEERIATLSRALQGFEAANAAYGASLPGALSTSTDLFELFRAAFFGPAFARMAELLGELNAYLIANKDAIKAYLTSAGERFRDFLESGVERARAAFAYVSANWDSIVEKVQNAVETMRRMAPIIASWAATFVKMKIAATVLGTALQAGSWLASLGSTLAGVAAEGGILGALGMGGAGAAGAGAAGAGAAAGGAAGAGGLAAVGAALSSLALPLAALAAIVVAVWQGFETFGATLMPMVAEVGAIFGSLFADFAEIFAGVWEFLQPIFAAVGGVLSGAFLAALKIVGANLRLLILPFRLLASILGWVGREVVKPLFETLGQILLNAISWFSGLGDVLSSLATRIGRLFPGTSTGGGGTTTPAPSGGGVPGYIDAEGNIILPPEQTPETTGAPQNRTSVHNDFRGSRITVEQSFREADPDRVAVRMIEDLQQFAEQRVSSGFAPGFTR